MPDPVRPRTAQRRPGFATAARGYSSDVIDTPVGHVQAASDPARRRAAGAGRRSVARPGGGAA
ncbi:hypothetical protein AWV63_11540 [Micromonospora rifamycinica]|nr:hypothetical protein AWV63_11540 [Micromonospora rifamycinica]